MNTSHSQGADSVITVDCPWCTGPARVADSELHCPECAVTVVIAADVQEPVLAAAA